MFINLIISIIYKSSSIKIPKCNYGKFIVVANMVEYHASGVSNISASSSLMGILVESHIVLYDILNSIEDQN